jgi:hypothetical protein
MGRKKQFKVQKGFTIGAKEIMWAQEKAEAQGLKLSTFVHDLIHKAMILDLQQAERKPSTWCTKCNAYRGFDENKGRWLCEECKEDKTDIIKYSMR